MPLAAAQPEDAGLLPRIHAYVERFQRELPSIVAEEHYVQVVTNPLSPDDSEPGSPKPPGEPYRKFPDSFKQRVLRSDVLMITVPGTIGWVSFRDVFEVDGQRIRDREDRLLDLLRSPDANAISQGERR